MSRIFRLTRLARRTCPAGSLPSEAETIAFNSWQLNAGAAETQAGWVRSAHGSRGDDEDRKQQHLQGHPDLQADGWDESPAGAQRQHQQQQQQQQSVRRRRRPLSGFAGSSGSADAAEQVLPQRAARTAMQDPLGMLMASTGVPLGITMRVATDQLRKQQHHGRQEAESEGGPSSSAGGGGGSGDSERSDAFSRLGATASAAAQHQPGALEQLEQQLGHLVGSAAAAKGGTAGAGVRTAGEPGGAAGEEAVPGDSWGTTRQSAAEIAQRIAESNRGLGSGDGVDRDGDDDEASALKLTAAEERYKSLEALQADLKELDEIFEILAKVPWMDQDNAEEVELRGVVSVGLLGTLEEVGWDIRPGVERIWGGERDEGALTEGAGPRESAALAAVLYHTLRLEEEHGAAPLRVPGVGGGASGGGGAARGEGAAAAAGGGGGAEGESGR